MLVYWPGVATSRYPAPLLRWELRLEPEYDYPGPALLLWSALVSRNTNEERARDQGAIPGFA